MKQIECRKDAIERVQEIMNERNLLVARTKNAICLCDIFCEIKDTEDVETLVELKTHINGILDNEIVYRLKKR